MGTDAPAREPRPRQIVDLPIQEPISTITPSPVQARARSYSASPSSSVSQPGTSAISGFTSRSKSPTPPDSIDPRATLSPQRLAPGHVPRRAVERSDPGAPSHTPVTVSSHSRDGAWHRGMAQQGVAEAAD